MKHTVRHCLALLGVTLMATQLVGPPAAAASFRDGGNSFEQAMPVTAAQKEVDRLLKKIASKADVASVHAEKLAAITRIGSRLSFETHATYLNGAKDAINEMGSDFRNVHELRASALPWQELLMIRMEPVLVGLATHTNDAVERLNEDRGKLESQEYRDAVGNMKGYAAQVHKLVTVNLDYAQARERLNFLNASDLELVEKRSPGAAPRVSSKAAKSLEERVRSELMRLPYYGVFDHLAFRVDGDRVTLSGHVSWPTLKTDAEGAARSVEGVGAVASDIKVLPVSPIDNRIRLATYWAIYGSPSLARYRLDPHPPIRIIVENGHVTLKGAVGSSMDRTIAHMEANRVPGTFSVTNNLQAGS